MDNNQNNKDELERLGKGYLKSLMNEIANEPLPDSKKLMKIANALHTLSDEDSNDDKEIFLKKFNDKYNLSLPLHHKTVHACKRGVVLAFVAALLLSLFAAQAVATYNGINLYDFLKKEIFGISYTIANAAPNDLADDKYFETITYNNPDNTEIEEIFSEPVLVLGKIPNGFTKEQSVSKMFGEENVYFERYSCGDKYIVYLAGKTTGEGILSVRTEGGIIERGKKVGTCTVDFFDNTNSYIAMFERNAILYQLESNLSLTEMEEIIKNLKENV